MQLLRRLVTDLSPRSPGLFPILVHVLFKADIVAVGQICPLYFSIISIMPCVRILFVYNRCYTRGY